MRISTDNLGLLCLSPFVSELETRGVAGDIHTQGIYHRFTGAAFLLSQGGLAFLRGLESTPLDDEDLATGGPALAETIVALQSAELLVAHADRDRLIAALRDYVLVRPLGNPAIVARDNDGRPSVIRPHRLSICTLPRTSCRPSIVEEPLGRIATQLIGLAQENRTLRQAETALGREGIARNAVLSALEFLCDADRQLLRLVPPSVAPNDPHAFHHNMVQNIHWSHPLDSASPARVAATEFYRHWIGDLQANFDWEEPTVSHAFREPTAAFGGRSYGARLGQVLSPFFLQCAREHGRLRILEIGAGLGFVAQSLIWEARQVLGSEISIDYTLMDISEALVARQKSSLQDVAANIRFVIGDAQRGLDPGLMCELVLANEVIADFDTREVNQGPRVSPEHTGVQTFIDLLPQVLVPGGKALLVEYGRVDSPPEEVLHLNHTEYAIDFRAVARHAKRRGFRVKVSPLTDVLQADDRAEMLVGQQETMLCWNVLLAKDGRTVDYRAYDRSEFLCRYGDIVATRQILGPSFVPMSAGLHFGPDLAQFMVLELTLVSST